MRRTMCPIIVIHLFPNQTISEKMLALSPWSLAIAMAKYVFSLTNYEYDSLHKLIENPAYKNIYITLS